MFASFDQVDWDLLHKQKLVLLTMLDGMNRNSSTADSLWGIVHLLDALQDDAVTAGRWVFPGESAVAVETQSPATPRPGEDVTNRPSAMVTIEGGVADVTVHTPGFVIEVRDYDVDGVDDEMLWTDENGDRCVRYFADHDRLPDPA